MKSPENIVNIEELVESSFKWLKPCLNPQEIYTVNKQVSYKKSTVPWHSDVIRW